MSASIHRLTDSPRFELKRIPPASQRHVSTARTGLQRVSEAYWQASSALTAPSVFGASLGWAMGCLQALSGSEAFPMMRPKAQAALRRGGYPVVLMPARGPFDGDVA